MHFDPYAQVFSKIVRGHKTDIADAKALVKNGLVDVKKLNQLVNEETEKLVKGRDIKTKKETPLCDQQGSH